MEKTTIILNHIQINQKIKRIAYQIYEANSSRQITLNLSRLYCSFVCVKKRVGDTNEFDKIIENDFENNLLLNE